MERDQICMYVPILQHCKSTTEPYYFYTWPPASYLCNEEKRNKYLDMSQIVILTDVLDAKKYFFLYNLILTEACSIVHWNRINSKFAYVQSLDKIQNILQECRCKATFHTERKHACIVILLPWEYQSCIIWHNFHSRHAWMHSKYLHVLITSAVVPRLFQRHPEQINLPV